MIPMPDLKNLDIPLLKNRAEAERYTSSLLKKQARPLLSELQALKDIGRVADFKLLPEQQAILVQSSSTDSKSQLSQLSNVETFASTKAENACGTESFAALQDQIYSISRTQDFGKDFERKPTQTEIFIVYLDGFDWGYIFGYTSPFVDVTLRILRAGQLLADEQTMTSTQDGEFEFYPEYSDCSDFTWLLQEGDVVEITAAGKTTSTTVVKLNFWVDPIRNQVAGVTAPGKSVLVDLDAPQSNFCSSDEYVKTSLSDATGHFNIDFSDLVDFNNASSAVVSVTGDNGHSIINVLRAYGIEVGNFSRSIYFYLKANTSYTANIKRLGVDISTFTGTTDLDGSGYFYSSVTLQAGDLITVQGGGSTLTYTVAAFSDFYVDVNTHKLTGKTDAGRKVSGSFYHRDGAWGYLQNRCSTTANCASATADNSGAFTLASSQVLFRGDYADVSIYDKDGNSQNQATIYSAVIIAGAGNSYLQGFWGSPDQTITIILKDSTDVEKLKHTIHLTDSYSFGLNFIPMVIEVGDTISVTDGVDTESMTVPEVHVELNKDTDQLSIVAPNNNAVVYFVNDNPRDDTDSEICSELQIINDGISIPYDDVGGQDYAVVTFRNEDGHYTEKRAHAAELNVNYLGLVQGFTMTPSQTVEVKLLKDSSLLETKFATSNPNGFYELEFDTDLELGDRIQVLADTTEEMQLPMVTIKGDIAENRIYGTAPANQPLNIWLENYQLNHFIDNSGSIIKRVRADAKGNFSASFEGEILSNCKLATVAGECVHVHFNYYDENEFGYFGFKDLSPNVDQDAWEDDNSFENAKMYTGYQKHTFHQGDQQDWVKFTVNPVDVGKPYYLMTTNLGTTMDTILILYESDGITEIARDDNSGGGFASQIYWIPDKSGQFYIRVKQGELGGRENCASSYDLFIARGKIWLPVIAR